jgi:hypothetical protein
MSSLKISKLEEHEVIQRYVNGESAYRISQDFDISTTGIYGLLERTGVKRRTRSEASRKYTLNEYYFEEIDSPNKAYFLGFLFADGYNNEARGVVELSSSHKDYGMLYKLNMEIDSSKPVRRVESNGIKSCRIDWVSSKLSSDLKRHGCIQAKTFEITMPDIREDLMRHFIRGYFDGDGCISYSYSKKDNRFGNVFNSVATVVGTDSFCRSLKDYLLNAVGVNSTILCRNKTSPEIKTVQVSGNQQVIKFATWLYGGANLYMERKRRKIDEISRILDERAFKCKE